jgi:hypothetical protein
LAIAELGASIRDASLTMYDSRTIAELRTFVRLANGKMQGSPHDDRVMSLAIANQMLKYVWLPEYRHDQEPVKNSLAWWERYIIQEYKPTRPKIGAFNHTG